MARWKKTLARMRTDSTPKGYTYAEAAAVLTGLGFELAPSAGGSHRKWRTRDAQGSVVVVGLVDSGSGELRPYLVREMLKELTAHGLVPSDLE